MNHPRSRGKNRGYQLTDDAAAFLSENHPRPYRLTPDAVAVLGKEKSHRQMVEETIDEMEQEEAEKPLPKGDKLAILMDCSNRLHDRFMTFFDALQAETDFKKRDALLAKCKNVQKASRRVTRKISLILEI